MLESMSFTIRPMTTGDLLAVEDIQAEAYAGYFATHLPENGLPARFTVHVVDVPDQAASYEFYGTALLQKSLRA